MPIIYVIILTCYFPRLLQVVRYHSLVIAPESLPRELVPIAWTSSPDAVPFLGVQRSDSMFGAHDRQASQQAYVDCIPTKLNRKSWPSCHPKEINGEKVLMGIMHSSRPHYGLQVGFANCFYKWNCPCILCSYNLSFFLLYSFILRVLQPVMGDKFSKTLQTSPRIIGSGSDHLPVMRDKFMLVNYLKKQTLLFAIF